jgi:hypothetical protein
MFSQVAEQRAQKLVAIQFFVLAPYVGFESIQALVRGEQADISWLGIALSASSLVVMLRPSLLCVAREATADLDAGRSPGCNRRADPDMNRM